MPLVSLSENGMLFWSAPEEQETLDLLGPLCADSIRLIEESWDLSLPRHIRVYVMTHWSHLTFHAASWPLRVLYALTLPLWYRNVRKMWVYVAGLTMRYRGGPAVGIKPIRLWETREDSLGRRIFYPLGTDTLRLHNIVCHELTHAYTAHLRLPLWLNEGMAMITVDRFLERDTVRHSTLQHLRANPYTNQPADYAMLAQMPEDYIVYAYVHGYWVTRYLFEAYPDLLPRLLAKRRSPKAIDVELARSLGTSPKTVWKEMNMRVLTYFADLEENKDASREPMIA